MTFERRLAPLVAALLVAAVAATTLVLVWSARAALLDKARADGQLIATLLAGAAGLAGEIPDEVEAMIGERMAVEASLAAQLVAVGEAAKLPAKAITDRLKAVVLPGNLTEFWITDPQGRAYLRTVPGVDFTFSPDAKAQPQAHVFWPLLSRSPSPGVHSAVQQRAMRREIDSRVMKYVGVPGVDKPRIVQVGIDAQRLESVRRRVGLERMVDGLLAGGGIEAIWVMGRAGNGDLEPRAVGGRPGAGVTPDSAPSEEEREALRQAVSSRQPQAFLEGRALAVAAPVIASSGETQGAVLVRLPAEEAVDAMRTRLWLAAAAVALIMVGAGVGASLRIARRQIAPVNDLIGATAAVAAGRFNPFSLNPAGARDDELGRLARAFCAMAREVDAREERLDAQERLRAAALEDAGDEILAVRARAADELRLAQDMRLAILPGSFERDGDLQAFAAMTPAGGIAGDFHDIFDLDARRVAVVIGDVSGRGVAAALFMMAARAALRDLARIGAGPGAVLAAANDRLCAQNPIDLFVTIVFAIYDRPTGALVYANGGHRAPVLVVGARGERGAERAPERLADTGGMALGVVAGQPYREGRCRLEPGDALCLYTDGVTDALSPDLEAFGQERLTACLIEAAGTSARTQALHVLERVAAFAGGAEPVDDIACLVLRRPTPGEEAVQAPFSAEMTPSRADAVS